MPAKTRNVHLCSLVAEKNYCNCLDVPEFVLEKARNTLWDFRGLSLKRVKRHLINTGAARLVCKECQHAGLLTMPIVGPAPGDEQGGYCNAEEDFAICPSCGHWAVIFIRLPPKVGDSI